MTATERQIKTARENGNTLKLIPYNEYDSSKYEAVFGSYDIETDTITIIVPNYEEKIAIIDFELMKISGEVCREWRKKTTEYKIGFIKSREENDKPEGKYNLQKALFVLKTFYQNEVTRIKKNK